MTGWCIALIPRDDDPVWEQSSEKVPHMTMLMLGEPLPDVDVQQMAGYVEHVASMLQPFYMPVVSRGVLGSDNADVLFFEKSNRYLKNLILARSYLLTDSQILNAYNSFEQYPEWTPHLTMGYPESPAKQSNANEGVRARSIYGVEFDKLALWTGEYTGLTFDLNKGDSGMASQEGEMAMADGVGNFFAHYGIKGMHWGQRKSDPAAINTNVEVVTKNAPPVAPKLFDRKAKTYQKLNADTAVTVVQRPGQRVATKGGSNRDAHPDAVNAATARRIAKSSSTDALSTKELQMVVARMNLEQQYNKLANPAPKDPLVVDFMRGMLGLGINVGKQQISAVGNDQAKQFLTKKSFLSNPNGNNTDNEPRPKREFDEQFDKARRAKRR
jgi:hypothetical protein